MDNFRAVYHILSELEKALDSPKVIYLAVMRNSSVYQKTGGAATLR